MNYLFFSLGVDCNIGLCVLLALEARHIKSLWNRIMAKLRDLFDGTKLCCCGLGLDLVLTELDVTYFRVMWLLKNTVRFTSLLQRCRSSLLVVSNLSDLRLSPDSLSTVLLLLFALIDSSRSRHVNKTHISLGSISLFSGRRITRVDFLRSLTCVCIHVISYCFPISGDCHSLILGIGAA